LVTTILIDIDNFFNNDVVCRHLSAIIVSVAQQHKKIVNWITTADGCVHAADTKQLDFAVGKFVQTRRVTCTAAQGRLTIGGPYALDPQKHNAGPHGEATSEATKVPDFEGIERRSGGKNVLLLSRLEDV